MKLLEDDFFTTGHLPKELPVSCLTTAPRFSSQINRKPLTEVKGHRKGMITLLQHMIVEQKVFKEGLAVQTICTVMYGTFQRDKCVSQFQETHITESFLVFF